MRVAIGLAINEIDRESRAIAFYELLSSFDFMCSSPTLFNAGALHLQLSPLGPHPLAALDVSSQDLTATVHTIMRITIGQYYLNQPGQRGLLRQKVQPGSITFIQRFGSALVWWKRLQSSVPSSSCSART